jgi:hypothetical protein
MKLRVALVAALILLAAIPSAPAAERGTAPFGVKVGKSKDGKFRQTMTVPLPVGERRDYFFRLRLKGDQPDHGVIFDDAFTTNPHPEGYRVQWYRNGENVSSEVKGPGYDLTLKAGKPRYFRVTVKALDTQFECVGGRLADLSDTRYAFLNLNGPCP